MVKRNIDTELQKTIDRLIKQSVEFAFANPESCMTFVKQHAQEMNEDVMKKHIALYVNGFSIDLGKVGKNAIQLLFDKAVETKLIEVVDPKIFVE